MKRPTHTRAGFSLIEAMVAAGILGIALVGLVQLHSSSIRGTVRAERLSHATEVARQRLENLSVQPVAQLDLMGCGNSNAAPPAAPAGCRQTLGPSTLSNPDKGGDCTFESDGSSVMDANMVEVRDGDRYRVDTWLSQHPNALSYPNAALLTVWVCWQEPGESIRELQLSRVVR